MALAGHSGMQTASMHSSGSITRSSDPHENSPPGTSTQSVYLHLIQFSVTTWVILRTPGSAACVRLYRYCRADFNQCRALASRIPVLTSWRKGESPALYAMVWRNDTRNHDNYLAARHRPVQIQHDAGGFASFPAAQVEYRYKCRTRGVDLHPYLDEIREEVHQLCQLRFTEDELNYLRGLRFIKSDFVDFLGLFHMPERCIHIAEGDAPGEISIEVRAHGCTPSSSRSRCWPSSTRSTSATRASIPTGKKAASGCSPRCTWCWTIRRWLISAWPNTARAAASPRSGTRKSCPP